MSVLATKGGLFSTPEFKANTDTHVAGGDGYAPFLTQTDQNGVWPYERPLVIADLFAAGTMSGTTIKYPVYGSLEGNATTVAEGGQKPQLHLPDPTWVSDSLHEVAAWWKIRCFMPVTRCFTDRARKDGKMPENARSSPLCWKSVSKH